MAAIFRTVLGSVRKNKSLAAPRKVVVALDLLHRLIYVDVFVVARMEVSRSRHPGASKDEEALVQN